MSASIEGTTAECMGCSRRVSAGTLVYIRYVGSFCAICGAEKLAEIAVREAADQQA